MGFEIVTDTILSQLPCSQGVCLPKEKESKLTIVSTYAAKSPCKCAILFNHHGKREKDGSITSIQLTCQSSELERSRSWALKEVKL